MSKSGKEYRIRVVRRGQRLDLAPTEASWATSHIVLFLRKLHNLRRFFRVRRFEALVNASDISAEYMNTMQLVVYLNRPCDVLIILSTDAVDASAVDALVEEFKTGPCA